MRMNGANEATKAERISGPSIYWAHRRGEAAGRRIFGSNLKCGCSRLLKIVEAERPVLVGAESRTAFVISGASNKTLEAIAARLAEILTSYGPKSQNSEAHTSPGGTSVAVVTVPRLASDRARQYILSALQSDIELRRLLSSTLSAIERSLLIAGQCRRLAQKSPRYEVLQFGSFVVQDMSSWLGADMLIHFVEPGCIAARSVVHQLRCAPDRPRLVRVQGAAEGKPCQDIEYVRVSSLLRGQSAREYLSCAITRALCPGDTSTIGHAADRDIEEHSVAA